MTAPDRTAYEDGIREAIALWLMAQQRVYGAPRKEYLSNADDLLAGPLARLQADLTAAEAEIASLRLRVREVEGVLREQGATPAGSGSHPTGGTPDGFPSQSDVDPSRMQWRTIATAPKDGSDILVYCGPDFDPMWGIAHWDDARPPRRGRPGTLPPGWMMWWQPDLRRHSWPEFWHPLPTPPAPCDGSGEAGETVGLDPKGDSAVTEGQAPALTTAVPASTGREGDDHGSR